MMRAMIYVSACMIAVGLSAGAAVAAVGHDADRAAENDAAR